MFSEIFLSGGSPDCQGIEAFWPAIGFPAASVFRRTFPSKTFPLGLVNSGLCLFQTREPRGWGWLGLRGDRAGDDPSAFLQSVVRICCIRSFGHFITHLQGSILQFNPELGIFISIAQAEQDNLLHQAQAQFHMVSW